MSQQFTVADASQYGIGAVLMQNNHFIAYISRVLSPKNKILSVYDKELLALVFAMEKWHPYLSVQPFVIKTDQKSLRYLLEQKLSTLSQFRWLSKLMGMDYVIHYKKGKDNIASDAPSRVGHGELLQLSVSNVSTDLWQMIKQEWEVDDKLKRKIQEIQRDPSKF